MFEFSVNLALVIVSFLVGSIPFGLLVGRFRGIDIRQHGSKNIGATNVGRVLGRSGFLLTLLGDFSKGALAVHAARHFSSNDLVVLVLTALLLVAMWFIVQRTKIGMAMRAVSYNEQAAALMGVNVNAVISFTFALGSALAAIAGIFYAMRAPGIEPLMGVQPGLRAFIAAVLGGIGNLPGAALGGIVLGLLETFFGGMPGLSNYRDAIAFAILILILLFRPAGLLGKQQTEKV